MSSKEQENDGSIEKVDKTSKVVGDGKIKKSFHKRQLLSLNMPDVFAVSNYAATTSHQESTTVTVLLRQGSHSNQVRPTEDELFLADWIANTKKKQLSLEKDKENSHNVWKGRYGDWQPLTHQSATSFLPWERRQTFEALQKSREGRKRSKEYANSHAPGRKLMDTFANSLLHVHRIYNRKFGYMGRKVPAHMPHMVDVKVMEELQTLLPEEFDRTSSHKLRSSDDMQFAFSYLYFVIGQKRNANLTEFFSEVDADHSGLNSNFVFVVVFILLTWVQLVTFDTEF